ncbi:MAG: hypothetical protein J1F06_00105 [Prevotellaceae bacterium]|nr:hypothetical protein [Prevotellaceae bacterium]
MKTPREIAEMIVNGSGEYELIKEAKAVARECERDLIDTYTINVSELVGFREWNGSEFASARIFQECVNRGLVLWKAIKTQAEADEYNETPNPEGKVRKVGDLVENWGLSITRLRIDIFINALNAALSEVDEVERATQPADLNPLNLPPRMNTERARKYIPKAIEAKYIKIKEQRAERDGFVRYKWVGLYKQILAYFMYEIYQPKYNPKEEKAPPQPPIEEIEETFGVYHIPQKNRQARKSTNANTLRQRETIDKFFED